MGAPTPSATVTTPPVPTPDAESSSSLLTSYLAYHREVQREFISAREFDVTIESTTPVAVVFLSDLHIGSEGVDMARLVEDFQQIARTPQVYLALGGDVIDNFILHGMTSAAQSSDAQVKVQWRIFQELMAIVREKLIFVSSGNHDAWTQQVAQIDGILAHLRDIPVVYTGEGGLIRLHLGNQTYRIFRKHKPTRGRNRKHPTNTLVEELHWGDFDYDVGVLEHEHVPAILQFRARQLDRIAIRCGTYKVRDAYAEIGGFGDSAYASTTVIFAPTQRKMLPYLYLDDALVALTA